MVIVIAIELGGSLLQMVVMWTINCVMVGRGFLVMPKPHKAASFLLYSTPIGIHKS